ncbi:MAG: MOSC N-terminal beta barrel domain-containing protein [Hylemonella sp.]|nr:MOSC N-terminal beta barrel domain-containing protein [Hylemonella sp.]
MSATPLSPADVQARIARLFVYPVKSCAGIEVSEALLTETGLDLDRAWMVVDEHGEFLSQREAPRLALVQPQFKRGGTELQLRAPGMLALHLRVDAVEAPTRVRVWDDEVPAWDMGDIAAQWFTDFLALNEQGLPKANAPKYRLVRFDPEHRRLSDRKWTGEAEALNQFSDGFAVLVLGQASLDGLNTRLQAQGSAPADVRRFRPNIVLDGLPEHDEDRVGPLQIETAEGPALLTPVKPCPRCPIPDIDPLTAHSTPEVGDTLQTYRQDARLQGAVTFGMNAIVSAGMDKVLRVGQPVSASYRFD